MSERINRFQKGERVGAARLNQVIETVNNPHNSASVETERANRQTTFVKILAEADGDEWYKGEYSTGQIASNGTTALDLSSEQLGFTGAVNCLIFNEAGDGQTGHSIEIGKIMRGFPCGRTSDNVIIFSVNPGGSPAAELPAPSYTGQVYQAVTDKVAAWQFPVSHTIP